MSNSAADIYIMITARQRNLVKIGCSRSPYSRASQLRRDKSDKSIRVYLNYEVHHPLRFECATHQLLEYAALPTQIYRGEWFSVSPLIALCAMNDVARWFSFDDQRYIDIHDAISRDLSVIDQIYGQTEGYGSFYTEQFEVKNQIE